MMDEELIIYDPFKELRELVREIEKNEDKSKGEE